MFGFTFRRLWGYLIVLCDVLFQKWKARNRPEITRSSEASLKGKSILITGPTSGIGKTTSWALVKRQAHVILACRNLERGKALKSFFEEKAERLRLPQPSMEIVRLDVSDLPSIEEFAQAWRTSGRHLDVLINNAGIFDIGASWKGNDEGMEQHMVTNYLGHFLLTLGLLPCLRKAAGKSGDARIVHVSSVMHQVTDFNFEDPFLTEPGAYTSERAYSQSKLAMILFGSELQRRLSNEKGITVCSTHPGEVITDVARGLPSFLQWMYKNLTSFILFTPEEGAWCSFYCATETEVVHLSRRHFGYFGSDGRPQQPSSEACSEESAKKLWEWSCEIVQLPVEWDLQRS